MFKSTNVTYQLLSERNYLYLSVVEPDFSFDCTNASEITDNIIKRLATIKPLKLILDLKNVTKLDSSAIGSLIHVRNECKKIKCGIYIINLIEHKRITFEIMGIDEFLKIMDSLDDILKE